jgi:hypothetical protein
MLTAAECMAKDGRTKEAEALFEKAMERYPDSLNGLIRYIRFLWEGWRYELVKGWKYPIDAVKRQDNAIKLIRLNTLSWSMGRY